MQSIGQSGNMTLPWLYNSCVRPTTVATDENQETVETLTESQESQPGTHDAIRKISRKMRYTQKFRPSPEKLGKKLGTNP